MTLHYLPAADDGWLALTAESRVLFVQVEGGAQLIDRVWAGISSLSGFQETLDELTRDGLSATPSFALLEWSDRAGSDSSGQEYAVRVIVRGAVTITITTPSGAAERLTGADVSTWIERSYPRAIDFVVHADAAGAAHPRATIGATGASELPLAAGAAWASAVMSRRGSPSAAPTTLPVEEQTKAQPALARHDAHADPAHPRESEHDEHEGHRAYFLDLSTGGRHDLASPVIVGRSPSAGRMPDGAMPRFVTIPGDRDISRNHVRFVVDGDRVVVTDLHSRNGTDVVLPGRSPQRLRAGEPMAVFADTVVDLGGGVTITVREGADPGP